MPCGSGGSGWASTSTRTSRPAGTAAFEDPLVALPGVYGTHHIGASTEQAQEAIAAEVVRIVDSFKAGRAGCPTSSTSPGGRRRPTCSSSATAIGRASSRTCSSTCGRPNINVQETENIVFEGAEAAIARINVDRAPSEAELDAIGPGNEDILSVQLVALQPATFGATAYLRRPDVNATSDDGSSVDDVASMDHRSDMSTTRVIAEARLRERNRLDAAGCRCQGRRDQRGERFVVTFEPDHPDSLRLDRIREFVRGLAGRTRTATPRHTCARCARVGDSASTPTDSNATSRATAGSRSTRRPRSPTCTAASVPARRHRGCSTGASRRAAIAAVMSALTVAELLVGPAKAGADSAGNDGGLLPVLRGDCGLCPSTVRWPGSAARIRATTGLALPDAAVVATAFEHDAAIIVTNDARWQGALRASSMSLAVCLLGAYAGA